LHISFRNGFGELEHTVCKGAFAVVNVGDNTEIAYMLHYVLVCVVCVSEFERKNNQKYGLD
jgi:hypothetical protein